MSTNAARKLLVVDDDPDCCRLLDSLLSHAGYLVSFASDGVEGFKRVEADRPDIVLTDWVMPKLDGLELVRKIRAELHWYPYILLVTGQSDQQLGLDAGADDFISKPIRHEHLLPRIRAGERIVTLQETLREKNLELNMANQQLAELAITDPLSGLLNRRAFFEESSQEWQRAIRYELPLSCLMIDIDRFKRINDTYGHSAGDGVIRAVGRVLRTCLRESDIVCRYGGEEFGVLLPNTPTESALALAERLRTAVSELAVEQLPVDFRFTISIGIATRRAQSASDLVLIDDADQALLAAKRAGRNRCVRHDELRAGLISEIDWQRPMDTTSIFVRDLTTTAPRGAADVLLGVLSHRDPAIVAHCRRVARLCSGLGVYFELLPAERAALENAALLHQTGRLALSDRELSASPSLGQQSAVTSRCQDMTLEIVKNCSTDAVLADLIRLAGQWYDGSRGTPAGNQIPLPARILATAKLFDETVHPRNGAGPSSLESALQVLYDTAGGQLDPEVVERFVMMIRSGELAAPTMSQP